MDCSVLGIPQGLNKTCNGIREKIISMVVQDYDNPNFAPRSGHTLDDVTDVDNWVSRANAGKIMRFNFASDAAKEGGDAVTVENTSNGKNYHVRYNLVSFTLYLEANECDYKEMQRVFKPGKLHKVFFEQKSFISGWQFVSSGVPVIAGYTAELVVSPNSIPVEDSAQGFEIKVTLQEQDEMDSAYTFAKPTNFGSLVEAGTPNGLTVSVDTIATIATSKLYIRNRCGAIKTGLDDEDIYLDGVTANSAAVTVTDNSDGTYTLDLTGVTLVQVKVGSPGSLTDISNVLDLSKLSA